MGIVLHLGDTPKREQGDPADSESVPLGYERVRKFVQQQRNEEQGCPDQCSNPDLPCALRRIHLMDVLASREKTQGCNNEPT